MSIIIELFYNLSLLVALSIITGFINHRGNKDWSRSLLQGILMGSASVIGMIHPLVVSPGLIFDGRSVMISLAGLFFGPIASAIAGLMALVFRINQGGTGVIMGTLVIIASATIGAMFYIRNQRRNIQVTTTLLFFMGIIVHVAMILLMFTLPEGRGFTTIKLMGLPILLSYPIATVIIGRILLEADNRRRLMDALKESQANLTSSNQKLSTSMGELIAVEEELRSQFEELSKSNELIIEIKNQLNSALDNAPIPIMLRTEDGEVIKLSRKWTEITGYTIQDIPNVADWTTKAYGTDKFRIQELINESYDSNIPMVDGEYRIKTSEGKVRIWQFNVANIGKSANGRKLSMAAATDITEHRLSEEALKTSEEKYRLLTEEASDVIWVLNLTNDKFTYISPSVMQLRGFTAEEAMKQSLEEALTPESFVTVKDILQTRLKEFIESSTYYNHAINEIQQPCKNGNIIWVEVSTRFRYNSMGEIEIVGASRSIEERKRAEKEILYLSYHDQLTGLYNRRFYEEALKRLDVKRNLPLTLVIGDVNGLKLINDSFGHVAGDKLLKKVADVIRKGCRDDDIIARLGGDEFVVILPKVDGLEAEKVINRLNVLSLEERVGSIDVSISFGYETKISDEEKIEEIFKKAEDQMYKKKLFESPSMRGKTIQAIINTLNEKNKREEAHSHRVSIFCKELGHALNLLEGEIQELKTVGLLHDIGKVAIDETILNKPGRLTDDEWKEIKRHPEIGYRILSTVNDMSDMANYVLYHHERWDGKGYPKGLKGEEIPLQARIIAVADTYDAMTSERSYRSALPEAYVIEELQKNAGIQFDPKLVSVFIEKVIGTIGGLKEY